MPQRDGTVRALEVEVLGVRGTKGVNDGRLLHRPFGVVDAAGEKVHAATTGQLKVRWKVATAPDGAANVHGGGTAVASVTVMGGPKCLVFVRVVGRTPYGNAQAGGGGGQVLVRLVTNATLQLVLLFLNLAGPQLVLGVPARQCVAEMVHRKILVEIVHQQIGIDGSVVAVVFV